MSRTSPPPITEIEFREPPNADRGGGRPPIWRIYTADFLREIAYRPGEWAVYRTGLSRAYAHSVASLNRRMHPHSEWMVRPADDGTHTVYARVLCV